ncbi:dUTP diphosphatase [Priestia flexa]|uniref:dUTP diphosphatase n=1 Tax=Priestia flexa TaxID=86664 RepID=UPI003D28ADDB
MNFTNLFEMQQQLDERIIATHPELKETDNLPWKILALQVELGECANEWRGFKKWSKNQSARNKDIECHACKGLGEFHNQIFHGAEHVDDTTEICLYCEGTGVQEKNPLLTEYVDCLHFILSIGLELAEEWIIEADYEVYRYVQGARNVENTIEQFLVVNKELAYFSVDYDVIHYVELVSQFLGLGEMLGFTWKQVEQAYLSKNTVNHQRQEQGY